MLARGPACIVSIFAGRIADTGRDPVEIVEPCLELVRAHPNIELLWASPREIYNLVQANNLGCHIITMTEDILKKMPILNTDLLQMSLDTVTMFHRDATAAAYTIPCSTKTAAVCSVLDLAQGNHVPTGPESEPKTSRLGQDMPPLVILCGGKGTRLGDIARDRPKALVPVLGQPFLTHQLKLMERSGFKQVTLCVGHFGDQIEEFITASPHFKAEIKCLRDGPELIGTGGALARACQDFHGPVCFTYGDAYLDIDFRKVVDTFHENKAEALMTVIDRKHVNHAANVVVENDMVTFYGKNSTQPEVIYIDYGF